jgi:hypothetical protein
MESLNPRLRRNRTKQDRNMIMEPLMATTAEATDMVRVGGSAVYRLIAARQRESIKIRRPAAPIGRLDPHVAAQSCGVVYVAGRSGSEVVIVVRGAGAEQHSIRDDD